MSEFHVHTDKYAGKCFWTAKRGRVSSMFSYDDGYISGRGNWNLDPAFLFAAGAQPVRGELPGAFRDAAPDRWGRALIERRFRRGFREKGETPRSLNEIDYLLGVSDGARQGCLRFSLTRDGVFEHPSGDVPKLVALPRLLRAAQEFALRDDDASIRYLLDAGSASLGGARPKAAVLDGERLLMAKFPHRHDEWDVIAWEWVAQKTAMEAGISVPKSELARIDGQNVLLTERFDRTAGRRLGYISAMTLLDREDGERADYAEIALGLRDVSVAADADAEELYRRVVFSILMNNTDDHLRNHGLVRDGSGWRLSPMFDVNPHPESSAIRATSVFGETERDAALAALAAGAETFGLGRERAEAVAQEVRAGARAYRKYADAAKIPRSEQAGFEAALQER